MAGPAEPFRAVRRRPRPRDRAGRRRPARPRYFGSAGAAYAERFGLAPDTFARIAVKARRHAAGNPYAVFRDPVTLEEVLASPVVYGPLTRLQCCPPTCGAAAAVLVSERYARAHGVAGGVHQAQAMTTDTPSSFAGDLTKLVGYDMSKAAAEQVYAASGVGPEDVAVVELHDCFTTNELLSYEALGLPRRAPPRSSSGTATTPTAAES